MDPVQDLIEVLSTNHRFDAYGCNGIIWPSILRATTQAPLARNRLVSTLNVGVGRN